jgi:predicted RNA-binding Zn-ribbon protein involved in translation (DUF1610 family)
MSKSPKKKKQVGPRIAVLDIETAPLSSYTWGLWEQNVGLEMIAEEWSILSFSVKWLGDKKVIYHDTGGRGKDRVRDDRKLLEELWKVLDQADFIIGQNAAAFDIKKINARLLIHGFKPYSPIKVIDTMLVAKKHFAFTSNKLQWLSKHLTKAKKQAHKKFPGFELWSECIQDNKEAWAEMKKYNIADILATEELFLVLRPWIDGINLAVYSEAEEFACPKCGSTKVQKRGEARTTTGVYHRFQCVGGCGGWSRSRYTTNTVGKRKSLLVG